jgi:hypothetical protein
MGSVAMITKTKIWAESNEEWNLVRERFLASQLSTAISSVDKQEFHKILRRKGESVREYIERFEALAGQIECIDEVFMVHENVESK